MTDTERTPPVPSSGGARWGTYGRATVIAAATVGIVLAVPVLPSAWAGLTHRGTVEPGPSARVALGFVTIRDCTRGSLHFDWSCRGLFRVNDPLAEPSPDVANVIIANDPRHYHRGSHVDTALPVGRHTGYRWGRAQDAKTIGLWAGLVLCLVAVGSAVVRRRATRTLSAAFIALGLGLSLGLNPLL